MIIAGGKIVGIMNSGNTILDNINMYKLMDLADILQHGGSLPTNEEYLAAETQLQQIYKNVMEGNENE